MFVYNELRRREAFWVILWIREMSGMSEGNYYGLSIYTAGIEIVYMIDL